MGKVKILSIVHSSLGSFLLSYVLANSASVVSQNAVLISFALSNHLFAFIDQLHILPGLQDRALA